jgi:hypothetical protein
MMRSQRGIHRMANERLEITRQGIGKLIKDGNLSVPPNQREYSWRAEHITDLYQDLAKAIADEEPDYFLGSIVVAKTNGQMEVFDGQQRLATTIILLAAVRNYYQETDDDKRAKIIESNYVMGLELGTLEEQPKFKLSKVDHDFYLKHVLSDDPTVRAQTQPHGDSHDRIKIATEIAAKHVQNIIAALPSSSRGQALNNWVTFLLERAMIICVQVPDDRSAYIVFETMNDRGLRPSAADLLKNHLFGLADNRINEAEQSWTMMSGALETVPDANDDIVVTYIRHLWISQHGPTRTKDLFDKIKQDVKGKQAAIDLANALAVNAPYYAAILNPAHDMWNPYGPDARKHIATLVGLGMEQMRPLLLAGLAKFGEAEINKFLLTVVCWAVRFLVLGVSGSGALEGQYGRNAFEITQGRIKDTDGLASSMADIIPLDDAFKSAFSTVRVAKANLARYYLRALQLKADGQFQPQYVPNDGAEINLEHVLPQSPSDEWALDADTLKANYRRLGNLVLLQAAENTVAGNSGYEKKKPVLLNSQFSLTREAGQYDEWTINEIDDRQSKLAELAVNTWPLRP